MENPQYKWSFSSLGKSSISMGYFQQRTVTNYQRVNQHRFVDVVLFPKAFPFGLNDLLSQWLLHIFWEIFAGKCQICMNKPYWFFESGATHQISDSAETHLVGGDWNMNLMNFHIQRRTTTQNKFWKKFSEKKHREKLLRMKNRNHPNPTTQNKNKHTQNKNKPHYVTILANIAIQNNML